MPSTDDALQSPRNARIVLTVSSLLVLGIGIWGLALPDVMTDASAGTVNFVLNSIGWL